MRPARTIALLLLSLTFSPCVVCGRSITYNLISYMGFQNSDTLTGTITTDGNTGTLTSSDILSWSYTIRTAGGTLLDQESGTTLGVMATGLKADTTSLTLPAGGNSLEFFPDVNQAELEYSRSNSTYEAIGSNAITNTLWDTTGIAHPASALGGAHG